VEGTVFNQHVSDNQFMTRSESPYTVHGLIEIEKSGTLTIESGVAINFYPGAGILVRGALIAKVRTTAAADVHYYYYYLVKQRAPSSRSLISLSFWFRVHISPSLFDCTTIV
jgi:hypothetical protein